MSPMAWALATTAVGGLVAYVLSRRAPTVSQVVAFLCSVAVLWLTAYVWSQPHETWEPLRAAPWWLAPYLRLDLRVGVVEARFLPTPLGNLVALGSAFFGCIVSLYALASMARHAERGRFAAFALWTLTGSLVVAWADNVFLFLLGWETVTLMLYLMVNTQCKAAQAAEKSFGILGFADLAMLVAMAFLMAIGKVRESSFSNMRVYVSSPGITIAYLLLLAAALAKAGALPLHSWLPAVARDADPPVVALLPASLDKLLGIYLLARISWDAFVLSPALRIVLLVIGAVTILAAVLMAMVQHNLKRLLGFHAVSQVGYMVLGIGTGSPLGVAGGLFHMLNNALYKSGLFLMAGNVERERGTAELDDLGGLVRRLPWTFASAVVFALAISGVPPLNGFVSKWLVYQASLSVGGLFGVTLFAVAVFGSALTLASFVKVLHSVFWGPEPEPSSHRVREPFAMVAPMMILSLLCVACGIWAGGALGLWAPLALLQLGFETTRADWAALRFQGGQWAPLQAAVLMAAAAAFAYLVYAIGGSRMRRVVDTFVAGERFGNKPPFFSGTQFYVTMQKLPILGGLLKDGEAGAFDVYRWVGLFGSVITRALRSIHSGLLNLYVLWALFGLAILVLVFAM